MSSDTCPFSSLIVMHFSSPFQIDRRRRVPHGRHLRRAVRARLGQVHGSHEDVDDAVRQGGVLCDQAARGVHLVRRLYLLSESLRAYEPKFPCTVEPACKVLGFV